MSKSDPILRSRGSWSLRHEMVGLGGVIERNVYLVRRYIWCDVAFFIWTVANTLSFEILTETVAWERWEGTIEYTFMAPLSGGLPSGRQFAKRHRKLKRSG